MTFPVLARARILIVDDNDRLRHAIAVGLRQAGYAVTEAMTGEEAVAVLTAEPCGAYDCVIMDYLLDFGATGGEAVNAMRRVCPGQRVIFLSGLDLPLDLQKSETCLQKGGIEIEDIIAEIERERRTRDTIPPGP